MPPSNTSDAFICIPSHATRQVFSSWRERRPLKKIHPLRFYVTCFCSSESWAALWTTALWVSERGLFSNKDNAWTRIKSMEVGSETFIDLI